MTGKTAFSNETGTWIMYDNSAEVELYPDSYVFFDGDLREGYYFDIASEELEEKIDIPYTIDVTAINANGVDVATITDLPDGCIATVNSESEQETEGVIVFGTDLAGVYQILLTHPLALDTILEVTAA